jgi:myo-inositol 2-dehydrogenase/D-chiro-inositol 1-dehydrogenase
VIGCGGVTLERHLPGLRSVRDARVVALADRDSDRVNMVADQFQIPGRSTDYRSLLDDPAIDAVAVCVPVQLHVEVALAALEAGKHLFIEKPLSLDIAEIDRLVERASRSSNKVMVGFNLRRHRLLREAREIIRSGSLGRLELIRSTLTSNHQKIPDWRRKRESGGGALIEMAVHHFDLWRFLLDTEVEEVFTFSRSSEWEDETATVSARLTNGMIAVAELCERTSNNNTVEVNGRDGRVRVDCYKFDGLEISPAANVPGDMRVRLSRIAYALRELPPAVLKRRGGDYVATYGQEWQHFIDSINRDMPVECTLDDGRRATQILLASLDSAVRGQPVKVAQA